jgi:surface carbohydrate biosynthesis protein (TIGR04326 family)
MDARISVTLKPHPVCPIYREDCTTLHFELSDAPLADIMPNFDLAFSSNSSSAGLDALLAGLSVVIFLDDEDFNHSPLRGIEGIRFASTAPELASAIQAGRRNDSPRPASEFFCVDSRYPRWRGVLKTLQ